MADNSEVPKNPEVLRDDPDKETWERLRRQIEHEDKLVHERIIQATQISGFLLATFAAVILFGANIIGKTTTTETAPIIPASTSATSTIPASTSTTSTSITSTTATYETPTFTILPSPAPSPTSTTSTSTTSTSTTSGTPASTKTTTETSLNPKATGIEKYLVKIAQYFNAGLALIGTIICLYTYRTVRMANKQIVHLRRVYENEFPLARIRIVGQPVGAFDKGFHTFYAYTIPLFLCSMWIGIFAIAIGAIKYSDSTSETDAFWAGLISAITLISICVLIVWNSHLAQNKIERVVKDIDKKRKDRRDLLKKVEENKVKEDKIEESRNEYMEKQITEFKKEIAELEASIMELQRELSK